MIDKILKKPEIIGLLCFAECSCIVLAGVAFQYKEYLKGFLLILLAALLMFNMHQVYLFQKLSDKQIMTEMKLLEAEENTEIYFRLWARDSSLPVLRTYETEHDLPTTGISNVIYRVTSQGTDFVWDSELERYIPSEYPTVDGRLLRAQQRIQEWRNQQLPDENWLQQYTTAPEISSDTINHMWQHHVATFFPHTEEQPQAYTEEQDDFIKNAPPTPDKKPRNRLKDILSRRKQNV